MNLEKRSSDQFTAARYSEIAKHYNGDWRGELTPELQAEVEQFIQYVGEPPKRILDSGCGTGKISTHLAQLGYSVFCLDLSEGMLREAVGNSHQQQVDIFPFIGNMRAHAVASSSMDAIWNMAALVHLDRKGKEQAITDYQRILSPGGVLHISVQNLLSKKHLERVAQSYLYWLGYDDDNKIYQKRKTPNEVKDGMGIVERFIQGYAYLDDRHWFFPTKMELIGLLKNHDFEILDANSAFAKRSSIFARKMR